MHSGKEMEYSSGSQKFPYWVCLKEEYISHETPDTRGSSTIGKGESESKDPHQKKRARDPKIDSNDRLCFSILRGEECSLGDKCCYNHNITEFLSRKLPDLGPNCVFYDKYGLCPYGVMCRFGDCHIDKETGKNLTRPEESGGVIDRVLINVLPKELQVVLRKKKYPHPGSSQQTKKTEKKLPGADSLHNPPEAEGKDQSVDSPSFPSHSPNPSTSTPSPPPSSPSSSLDMSTPYPSRSPRPPSFHNAVYVAPLTTVGNLPFRRILKEFGADVTCGEMAMSSNIEVGQASEWALLRRHASEDQFGVQLAGPSPSSLERAARIVTRESQCDFIDINSACPIDLVCDRGGGASMMTRPQRLVETLSGVWRAMGGRDSARGLTLKIRTGWDDKSPSAHKLLPTLQEKVGADKLTAIMIHGRSRLQRYSRLADWEYVLQACRSQRPSLPRIPVIGNGDILTWEDWASHRSKIWTNLKEEAGEGEEEFGLLSCAMLGRGALIKPWLPREIKEGRHWDISAQERLDIVKKYCEYGLEHWGSDQQGVNNTRRFLLEWLSFMHRYVPVGLLETEGQGLHRQRMIQRPPLLRGRCDLETLLASGRPEDWVQISSMFLGPPPESFSFSPKHVARSYPAQPPSASTISQPSEEGWTPACSSLLSTEKQTSDEGEGAGRVGGVIGAALIPEEAEDLPEG